MSSRRLWCLLASLAVCGGIAVAQSNEPVSAPEPETTWLDALWNLPVFRWLSGASPDLVPPPPVVAVVPAPPACSVEPLKPIDDMDALSMENSADGEGRLNLSGLTPRTSRALARFERLVAARGGAFTLKSAYRPAAYQWHLRDVWFKWVGELRENTDPACAQLRAEVGDEFARHHLLVSQYPVTVSDHTLGIGFDAAVVLPAAAGKRAKRRRRSVSLDALARLSGVLRPDIRRDPVHFRLIGGRG